MKTFLSMFAASTLAALFALITYDVFVAQPRERRMQAAQQAFLQASGETGLARRREEAAEVAQELEASVDRTLAGAREAMARDAASVDSRGRIAEGLMRASMFKLAVAETWMSQGRWPHHAAEAGLGDPESYAGGAVAAIALESEGAIMIRYSDEIAPAATMRLLPQVRGGTGSVDWRCEAEGFPDRSVLPAACR